MFIGSNIICIYGNSVKIARIGNLKFLINGEGEKNSIKGEALINREGRKFRNRKALLD